MSWIDELKSISFHGGNSQIGESAIIQFIFQHIGETNKYYIDIGAGYYDRGQMSNTDTLLRDGWSGLKIDDNNNHDTGILKLYVTPDNILPFLKDHNVPYGFDLLSIDIDSFDLDIMEKVVPAYHPRLICTEYNGTLHPDSSVKLKYEPGYIWDETNKYGYSFGAAVKFCGRYGYKILMNHANQNLFLIRSDIIQQTPVIEVEQSYYHTVNSAAQWEEY